MCSLPTMKFRGAAAPDWAAGSAGAGSPVLWRGGPLSFSLCTYRVRITKNCPLEFAISFKTLRAAAGVALKVRSTMFRFNNAGGGVAVLAVVAVRPATGDGVGVDEPGCSSDKGERRKEVTLSTFASSRMFSSIWI